MEDEIVSTWEIIMRLGFASELIRLLNLSATCTALERLVWTVVESIEYPVVLPPKYATASSLSAFAHKIKRPNLITSIKFPRQGKKSKFFQSFPLEILLPFVEKLDFEDNQAIGDKKLCTLLSNCRRLKILSLKVENNLLYLSDIKGCRKIQGGGLLGVSCESLSQSETPQHTLTELTLSGCHLLEGVTASAIFSSYSNLTSLDLSGFKGSHLGFNVAGLEFVRSLNLRACNLEVVKLFLWNLPNLDIIEVLDISRITGPYFISDDRLLFPSLRVLEIQNTHVFSASIVEAIITSASSLQELNLIDSFTYSNVLLFQLNRLSHLRRLELKGHTQIDYEILTNLFQDCEKLAILNLDTASEVVDSALIACAKSSGAKNKRVLNFKRLKNVTDYSILEIASSCLNLKVLNLAFTSVSDISVVKLITQRNNTMEFIDLESCTQVTTDILSTLIDIKSMLFKIGLRNCFASEDPVHVEELLSSLAKALPFLKLKR